MGQALYRKYRSKHLSEIVGQEHITRTLDQALKSGRISHAYLFTGPRGVGKTSIARILAHDINNLPYEDDTTHLDIIEIDAASNRRIDEIRDLREKVYIAPAQAKYKVYIIDEVHMLTKEAFNALLKTLEEPPAHVVFILATTDAHKLPETIISRTQRFNFRPVDKDQVIDHLSSIAKQEKIKISDEALALLAEHGEGSFRDSISLLDQAQSYGDSVEAETIHQLLGMPPSTAIQELLQSLFDESSSSSSIASRLVALQNQGYQASAIAKELGKQLRQQILQPTSDLPPDSILELSVRLLEVPVAHDPQRFLELILLATKLQNTPAAKNMYTPEKPASSPVKKPEPPTSAEPAPPNEPKTKPAPKASTSKIKTGPVDTEAIWPQVLDALKHKYNTLYGVVRMANPAFQADQTLQLTFAFAFHQKRVNEAKNQQIISDIIEQLSGQRWRIDCIVDTTQQSQVPKAPKLPPDVSIDKPALTAINTIFGGGEVIR